MSVGDAAAIEVLLRKRATSFLGLSCQDGQTRGYRVAWVNAFGCATLFWIGRKTGDDTEKVRAVFQAIVLSPLPSGLACRTLGLSDDRGAQDGEARGYRVAWARRIGSPTSFWIRWKAGSDTEKVRPSHPFQAAGLVGHSACRMTEVLR